MAIDDGIVVTRSGAALVITLNRPDVLNALTPTGVHALADEIEAAGSDPAVRAIVLTGTGRAFCTGAELGSDSDDSGEAMIDGFNRVVLAIRETTRPVLAAVNGIAAGAGACVALACDLVLARESAYFVLSFANIGLMPDAGGTALLPAAIGRARAARMTFLAERVPAPTAFDWGLISSISADESFDTDARAMTERLAAGPTAAFARTKQAFNATTLPALQDALAFERKEQLALLGAPDFAEGVRAFRERRTPVFTDLP